MTCMLFISACVVKNEDSDLEEMGQQVGETMASIDEVGGSSGSFPTASLMIGAERLFARKNASPLRVDFLPNAHAGACVNEPTFSNCVSKKITRTFSSCTVGLASFTGTIDLNFTNDDNNCLLDEAGETVVRAPNFAVTGRRGATLSVTKSGTVGQTITRGATAGSFTFANDGIRRSFTTAAGQTLFKYKTETTSPLTITGTSRLDRVITGGTLKITDELTQETCDVTPNNLTWNTASCNCAVSGNWSGTCSSGDAVAIVVNGCGLATLTKGETSVSVVFDRCY